MLNGAPARCALQAGKKKICAIVGALEQFADRYGGWAAPYFNKDGLFRRLERIPRLPEVGWTCAPFAHEGIILVGREYRGDEGLWQQERMWQATQYSAQRMC